MTSGTSKTIPLLANPRSSCGQRMPSALISNPPKHLQLLSRLPANLRTRVEQFEELTIQVQAATLRELRTFTRETDQLLFQVSVERKMADPRYSGVSFSDPTIHRVARGHLVDCVYEDLLESGGFSRVEAAFCRHLIAEAERGAVDLVGVEHEHKDIQGLGLSGKEDMALGPPLVNSCPVDIGQVTGLIGLLRLQKERPDHPAFRYDKEETLHLRQLLSQSSPVCAIKHARGLVTQEPNYDNQGVMVLESGQKIVMGGVRIIHIIGADEGKLLTRDPAELYRGKPCRVWYGESWHTAVVWNPTGPHNMVEVRTDKRIHDRPFFDGHGLTIGSDSNDLDLRDPAISQEKDHPLKKYPGIRKGRCVAFDYEGERLLGEVTGVDPWCWAFQVTTERGTFVLKFDEKVEYLPPLSGSPAVRPGILKGNKIAKFDPGVEKTRIYEIVGYDRLTDSVIARLVSLRSGSCPSHYLFPAAGADYTVLSGFDKWFERFPCLRTWSFGQAKEFTVEFKWAGGRLKGKLYSADTIPAFLEVIIEKIHMAGKCDDAYLRYDVRLEDVISIV